MPNTHFLSVLICGLLCSVNVCGQLSYSNNSYQATDLLEKQQVEYLDPGSKGVDLTWNFSMLHPINDAYTVFYSIPDSNYLQQLCGTEHRTRYYYTLTSDTLWITGYENATTRMTYTRPELRLRFPFAYGDTLAETFSGTGEYGRRIPLFVSGFTRVQADAVGDLTLPDGRVRNALRVRTQRHYVETGLDSTQMNLDIYTWYAQGCRYPVFESIAATQGDSILFRTSFYYPSAIQHTEIDENEVLSDSIDRVFTEATYLPNPVETQLQIQYKLTRPATVWFSLHGSTGIGFYQSTPQQQTEGLWQHEINMSCLMTGGYTLYVHVDDMIKREVIIKK